MPRVFCVLPLPGVICKRGGYVCCNDSAFSTTFIKYKTDTKSNNEHSKNNTKKEKKKTLHTVEFFVFGLKRRITVHNTVHASQAPSEKISTLLD